MSCEFQHFGINWFWWNKLKVFYSNFPEIVVFCFFFCPSLRWVGCWQVKTCSQLWTAFWRGSVTSNNSSPPGLKICLRSPRPPRLPPGTHPPTAPQLRPPAPPPPATSTWRRCSNQRRQTKRWRRRQRALRRYLQTVRSRGRHHHNPGAGESALSIKQDVKTEISFIYRAQAYNISQAIKLRVFQKCW